MDKDKGGRKVSKKPVGMEIRMISNMLRRQMENNKSFLDKERITGANGLIISYLAEHEGVDIYQKDLEERLAITRSTASKIITLMEQKGYITRESVSHDKRLKRIRLTDESRKIYLKITAEIKENENTLIKGFSKEEIHQLHDYINRMKENIINCQNEKNH